MHIVLVTIGTRGDAQPFVALGMGFAKAGHRVTIATNDDFADLVDQQKELTEKIEALQEKLENATTDAEKQALQEELNDLLDQQTKLNEQLMQQADAMENFIRDEPLYDVEKSLQEMLAERAQDIRDSVEQNQKATDALKPPESGNQGQPPGQSPPSPEALQQLAEAAREHRDNLAGGQQKFLLERL